MVRTLLEVVLFDVDGDSDDDDDNFEENVNDSTRKETGAHSRHWL